MNTQALISVNELVELAASSQHVVIADCRFALDDTESGRRAYHEAHIPGAVYAHLDEDLSGEIIPGTTGRHPLPDPADFAETLSNWGVDNETCVVVYDNASGPFAARLWWMMHWIGHARVSQLAGGISAYRDAGHSLSAESNTPVPRSFVPNVNHDLVLDADGAAKFASAPEKVLVDSRAPERYRGDVEPLDRVGGHIPGAINIPFTNNLAENGEFNAPPDIKSGFDSALEDAAADNVAFYCGSGVTAAHNALAYYVAGLGMPKIYAGSWSDWICDPNHEVATSGK